MKTNMFFILLSLISFYSNVHCISPITTSNTFLELITKTDSILKFSDIMREQHMNVISKMKQYIVNFPQISMKADTKNIESKIKKYLSRMKLHVTDLNKSFDKQYLTCRNKLKVFNRECHSPTGKLKSKLKYNKKYIKNLQIIDKSLDDTLAKHYKSKISSVMKNLIGICERNNNLKTFKKITNKLKSHFNILTETKLQPIKTIKKDSLVQKLIINTHHHHIRIPMKKKNEKLDNNDTKKTEKKKIEKKKKCETEKSFRLIVHKNEIPSPRIKNSIIKIHHHFLKIPIADGDPNTIVRVHHHYSEKFDDSKLENDKKNDFSSKNEAIKQNDVKDCNNHNNDESNKKIYEVAIKKNDDEDDKINSLRKKIIHEKNEFETNMYNKAAYYFHNATKRRRELLILEKGILNRMKANDVKVSESIKNLERFRKGNGHLIISLERDNETTNGKIRKCGMLETMKMKCLEMSKIYQSILSSYDEQSHALDRIFEILKKNK